jgi:hypothetical protein
MRSCIVSRNWALENKESGTLKTVRLCAYLLLYGSLLTPHGCEKAELRTEDVVITNCGATPDTVQVREGDQVHWQASTLPFSQRIPVMPESEPGHSRSYV